MSELNLESDDNLRNAISEYFDVIREEQAILDAKYPTDIPNESCHFAIVTGIKFENSFGPRVSEISKVFETEYEKVYVWTHSEDKYSVLISEVSTLVKELNFWKNIGYVIQVALDYYKLFETVTDTEYKWCYYFKPTNNYDDLVIYDTSKYDRYSMEDAVILKLTDIFDLARLIELFLRDDVVFTAVNNFYSSMKLHHCCLICELSKGNIHHPSHEPEIWEQSLVVSSYESAIVQACRCVEALVGKPPKRDKASRVLSTKEKWKSILDINPDDIFDKSEKTYFEYYYDLFESRNAAAHSYGTIPFELERKHAIIAQCFAAKILDSYIYKHVLSVDEAIVKLDFNIDLIDKVHSEMSVKATYSENKSDDSIWRHLMKCK